MNAKGFKICADCSDKLFLDSDNDGRNRYYCALVDGIVRKAIIYDSTDASACIKWNLFKPLGFATNQ